MVSPERKNEMTGAGDQYGPLALLSSTYWEHVCLCDDAVACLGAGRWVTRDATGTRALSGNEEGGWGDVQ
jgi:hypothetical protein